MVVNEFLFYSLGCVFLVVEVDGGELDLFFEVSVSAFELFGLGLELDHFVFEVGGLLLLVFELLGYTIELVF